MSLDLTSASLEVQYMHMYVKCRSMTNFLSLLQGEHTGERWDGSGTVLPHIRITYLHMCGCKLLYHATTSRTYSYMAMFDIKIFLLSLCRIVRGDDNLGIESQGCDWAVPKPIQ